MRANGKGWATIVAAFAAIALRAEAAAAGEGIMSLDIDEDRITSLANAPALIAADAAVDGAGRPALALELEFVNDCYADIGAEAGIVLPGRASGSPVLTVTQRIPPEGCPEIFQPTRRTVAVTLPDTTRARSLVIVARPATEDVVRRVPIDPAPDAAAVPDAWPAVGEATGRLPKLEDVAVAPHGATGYAVSGRLDVSASCGEADLDIRVFEIPDAEGTPTADAILVSTSDRCAGGDAPTALVLRVDTPQPWAGRRVVLLNTDPVQTHRFD